MAKIASASGIACQAQAWLCRPERRRNRLRMRRA
jgi:hypothetical protein